MKTAESVTPKHPDKMADQISDAILDSYLSKDPFSRVAVEVMGGHGEVHIMGEITSKGYVSEQEIFNIVYRITGKDDLHIQIDLAQQSLEIAQGVDTGGAGDQGIMNGYACNDNEEMIPQELYLARQICKYIYGFHPYDGKTQITLNDKNEVMVVLASFQNVSSAKLKQRIAEWANDCDVKYAEHVEILTNPAGDWAIGGFDADTGLTGRKLVIDNYGTNIPVGGGAFSGKDSTKVDRSAAYIARKIAIDILRFEEASEVYVQLAYAIGVAHPVQATSTILKPSILHSGGTIRIKKNIETYKYNLTPKGIIDFLELRKPQFEETARWGHFGNNFKWDGKEL